MHKSNLNLFLSISIFTILFIIFFYGLYIGSLLLVISSMIEGLLIYRRYIYKDDTEWWEKDFWPPEMSQKKWERIGHKLSTLIKKDSTINPLLEFLKLIKENTGDNN